jgi:RimJ/RimL family protein N-acetyltransferase
MGFSFQGESVKLRAFEETDLASLGAYLNHPELSGRRYIPWRFPQVAPLATTQIAELFKHLQEVENGLHLAVEYLPEDKLVGHASLDWGWDAHSPSLSLVITPDYQRRGLGTQALQILLAYLFTETPAHNVGVDWICDWNRPALTFVEKNGFKQCGIVRWVGVHAGRPMNMVAADLLRHEWQARKGERHVA